MYRRRALFNRRTAMWPGWAGSPHNTLLKLAASACSGWTMGEPPTT
jgi:hypothetical protein